MKESNVPDIIEQNSPKIRYVKNKLLGKGGFAKCYQFDEERTGKPWAIKVIPKSTITKPKHQQKLESEIHILKFLNHPNTVKFQNYIQDQENHYIIMELCPFHTLKELIKRRKQLTIFEVRYYVYQLLNALQYLHSVNVIHRDLKLGNLYLSSSMNLKVGDYGLSALLENRMSRRKSICGTPNYIAPEVVENKDGYSFEVDIWSVGVIIYYLIVGKPPFDSKNIKETYSKIKSLSSTFLNDPKISDSAKEIISNILVINPKNRPTIAEILNSRFMTETLIPDSLPTSSLTSSPLESFLSKYLSQKRIPNKIEKNNLKTIFNFKNSIVDVKSNLSQISPNANLRPATANIKENRIKEYLENTRNMMLSRESNEAKSKVNNKEKPISISFSTIFLSNYKDLTDKYCVGYRFNTGNIGFFYNDQTNLTFNIYTNKFCYSHYSINSRDNMCLNEEFDVNSYPESLTKKIKILRHYKKIDEIKIDSYKTLNEQYNEWIYVKSFVKTKHGILFKLSNNITQMCFSDNSSIILNYINEYIIFKSKKNDMEKLGINIDVQSIENRHIVKRLKYTLDLINKIIEKKNFLFNK